MSQENLISKIQNAMKEAMRAKDQKRLNVIRLMLAAIKQQEIDSRTHGQAVLLDDGQVIAILDKMIKQRRDSVEQYRQGGRADLVEQESYEIEVVQEFLPAALTEDEIEKLIVKAITDSGASSIKDMGRVMAILKPLVQGRADMKIISDKIKEKLG